MRKKLLVILVDGCREDYIQNKDMPFTSSLYQGNVHSPLKTILGYSNAIRATAFTGTLPSTHGRWCNFAYDPLNSPYRDVQYLEFLDHIPVDIVRRATRFFLSKTFMKRIARQKDYHSLELGNIPIHFLKDFDYSGVDTESVGSPDVPSLFEILARNGVRYKYLEFPYLTTSKNMRSFRNSLKGNEVSIVYLPHLDGAAHWFGISSQRFHRKLQYVDGILEQLLAIAGSYWNSDYEFLLFSDHGMSEVNEYVDFFHICKNWKFQVGIDYNIFLDSTMARFWYKNARSKDEIREHMEKLGGHFLSTSEFRKYGIAFDHNRYGEEIYLMKPGSVFFPCYLSWVRPKAMHGYSPAEKSQDGVVVFRENGLSGEISSEARMIDIMPTLLEILNVPTPSSCEGRSLLGRVSHTG